MRIPYLIFYLLFLIFSNLLFSQIPDASSISMDQDIPMDPAIRYGKLPNGITYYIKQNHKPENRAELRLVVNAGSILENDPQQGLAHLVEHMAFNGTQHFKKQEIIEYLESVGMRFGPDINAYTSFDETVYMLQIPTDSMEIMEKAFLILSDWAHTISFSDEEMEKERGVVLEEWRLGRGANARMQDKQFPILLHDSRYAQRLPIGKKEIIENFSYNLPKEFYHDWYRPDLMAIIAVGDFDTEVISDLIEKNFNQIKQVSNPRERKVYPVPDHDETFVSVESDSEATYSRVSIYYKLPVIENRTTSSYRQNILKRLYNRMLNGRLSELTRIENPPFIYAVSREGRMIRSKNFYILSAVVEEDGLVRGIETLLAEAKRIQQHGFTETELERNKKALLRSREQQYAERDKTESSRFAAQCVGNFLYQNSIPDIGYKYHLDQRFMPDIRLEEINQLAGEWTSDKNRVILANSPIKDNLYIPTESEFVAVLERVQLLTVDPYVDEVLGQPLLDKIPKGKPVVSELYHEKLDVTEWKLENGIRIILKPTDFKNDEIRVSAFSPGGNSLVEDIDLIAAESVTGIMNESGIGAFSKTQLMKYLSGKIVRVAPYIGELSEGISAFTSPKDIETLFQLIYLTFTEPREDSSAFLAFQERMIGIYQNRSASPEAAFYDTLSATLTQYHPRYRPWSVETVQNFDLKKSLEIYRNRFADASDFTFLFVGNFTVDSLKPYIEKYLGGLPVTDRQETWQNKTYQYPTGKVEKKIFKGKEPKSQTSIAITGPFNWDRREKYICNSMLQVLRIRLRERLREDLSGTYSISVNGGFVHIPIERYRITFQFGSDPDRVDELIKEIYLQVDSLRSFGTTEEYLQKVKELQLRAYETNIRKNNFWISNLEYKYFHAEPIEDILTYPDLVNELTLDDIQNAAKKYLNKENLVRVTLFPENIRD